MNLGWLFECTLCHHQFLIDNEDYYDLQFPHCPNCDLNKNRFGFCQKLYFCDTDEKVAVIKMLEMNIMKTVTF